MNKKDEKILAIVSEICNDRRKRHTFPIHALNTEIKQASPYSVIETVEALRRLRAEGKIGVYRTINHTAVIVIENQNNN